MEQAVLIGYRPYKYTDPKTNKVYEGYTLFLLESMNPNSGTGYIPLSFYDRFNNRSKYPSVSLDFFKEKKIDSFKMFQKVNLLFDRNNHLIEFVAAN